MSIACPLCMGEKSEKMLDYPAYPLYIKPVTLEEREAVPLRPLHILLCHRCGCIYQDDCVDPQEIERIYRVVYQTYHSPAEGGIGRAQAQDFLRFLESHVELRERSVLEIGCYDGYLLSLIRERYGTTVAGCDPSPGADIARAHGIPVVKAFFSPDLLPGPYDLVIIRGVLEHLRDPVRFLRMCSRVLGPKGALAVEVPDVKYSLRHGVVGDFFHEHQVYFSRETLEYCLSLAGFLPVYLEQAEYYLRGVYRRGGQGAIHQPGIPAAGGTGEIHRLFHDYAGTIERMRRQLAGLAGDLPGRDIYLYGGGGHTIGLLGRISDLFPVRGVIDGDPAKAGKFIPGFGIPVFPKSVLAALDPARTAIIVSSRVYQDEIVRELAPCISRGMRVLVLYRNVEYVEPPTHHPKSQETDHEGG